MNNERRQITLWAILVVMLATNIALQIEVIKFAGEMRRIHTPLVIKQHLEGCKALQ